MLTLILNGSPRPEGDTAALIGALRSGLHGEIVQVDCYRANVSPCVDCRRCVRQPGCAIDDGMTALYPVIAACDSVVVATPVYFSLPTPPLLSVASRLQTLFCARFFRQEPSVLRAKRGGILLAGSAVPAEDAARRMLRAMNARQIGPTIASLRTDELPAAQDRNAIEQAARLAAFLSRPL